MYLSVRTLKQNDENGTGRRVQLRTTGWLPYTLSWISTLTEPVQATGFAFTAEGDFNGTGRWIFRQDGPSLVLAFDWQISVDKPVVRQFTWLFRPLFTANHRWAMARGLESLQLELLRRASGAPNLPGAVPPGPTFPYLRSR